MVKKKPVNPKSAPASPFYSQGMTVEGATRTLYISGQVGVGPDGQVGADIAEQAQLAIANVNAVLAEAGMSSANIVKNTIYLTDAALMEGFAMAAAASLPNPPPATTLLVVMALAAPNLLVEIEAVAVA